MALNITQLSDIMEALEDVRERFEMEADVEDAPNGEQHPNRAMRCLIKIDGALVHLDREFALLKLAEEAA